MSATIKPPPVSTSIQTPSEASPPTPASGPTPAATPSTTTTTTTTITSKPTDAIVGALPKAPRSTVATPMSGALHTPTGVKIGASLTAPSKKGPGALVNNRFTKDPKLAKVALGQLTLGPGSKGTHITKVQKALVSMGYPMPKGGADGAYGGETVAAVRRLQFEADIRPVTGKVDKKTLKAMDTLAPPEGKKLDLNIEYDKLFKDGRVDVTIALGFDEDGVHNDTALNTRYLLNDGGFEQFKPEELSTEEREKLGVGKDRYLPGAHYFKKEVDGNNDEKAQVVIRMLTPDSYPDAKDVAAGFRKALAQDEVVIYAGHARYGTGPDFDHIDSGDGNFVVDRKGNRTGSLPPKHMLDHLDKDRKSDLHMVANKPDYQVLFLNGCSTENYLYNLRSDKFDGRTTDNTDIITTTQRGIIDAGSDQVDTFLTGLINRESMSTIMDTMTETHKGIYREFGMDKEADHSDGLFLANGLSTNKATRIVVDK